MASRRGECRGPGEVGVGVGVQLGKLLAPPAHAVARR
jgi:hypothetical protein